MNPIGKYVVVRCKDAGVHCGTLAEFAGRGVALTGARRVWSWKGANTLNEVSLRGVGPGSRVSEAVAEIHLTEACEVIVAAAAARQNLEAATWSD